MRRRGAATMLAAVNEQAAERRWVLHLLHYIPERRGTDFDTIEDVIPVFDLKASVKIPRKVREVVAVPQGLKLAFAEKGGRVEFTLRKLDGHQMIALHFA